MTACQVCRGSVTDAHLCSSCTGRLRRYLGDLPALMRELEVTRTRRDKIGGGGSLGIVVRAGERPLPWSERASKTLAHLRGVLVFELSRFPGRRPALLDELPGMLAERIDDLRLCSTAGESYSAIEDAVRRATRTIDRPQEAWYAGPCDECKRDLYARSAAAKRLVCRDCGTEYDPAARREWLLKSAEGALLTASEMSRALSGLLGEQLSASTIRGWIQHKRLLVRYWLRDGVVIDERQGKTDRGLIRVGDVLELRAQSERRA